MNPTNREARTLQYYNQHAEQFAAMHNIFKWHSELASLQKYLPSGRLLEVGSGTGRDAEHLMQAGYDYVGIDASEEIVKIAKKKNPSARFLRMNAYDLGFEENSFDGFWAVAIFVHIPKSRIFEVLKNVHHVVRSDGTGIIVVKKGKGEGVDESLEGGGRFFAYYSMNEFKKKLNKTGFEVVSSRTFKKNEKTTWLIYTTKVIK